MPGVLIFERAPRFEPALKRLLATGKRLVRPCRSTGDLVQLATKMPGSVVVIVWDDWPGEALRVLEKLLVGRVPVRPVVLAGREWWSLEWKAREAGAVEFLELERPAVQISRVCLRLLS